MNDALVVVIDDHEPTRSALAGLMRAKGFDVRLYASAEDFLQSDARHASRCIITDIQMAGLSGIELKQHLKAENCATPVIMITARAEPEIHRRALGCGAYSLLRKPFKAQALIDCVEQALAG